MGRWGDRTATDRGGFPRQRVARVPRVVATAADSQASGATRRGRQGDKVTRGQGE